MTARSIGAPCRLGDHAGCQVAGCVCACGQHEAATLTAWEQTVAALKAAGVTPYFEDEDVVIVNADCRDVLPLLPAGSVDLVLTDPPYNIGFGNYLSYEDKLSDDDYIALIGLLQRFRNICISQYPEETMRLIVPALGPPYHVGAWCYNSMLPRRFRLLNYYGIKPEYSRIKQPYKNQNDKRIQWQLENGYQGSSIYEWWDDIQLVKNISAEKTAHPCPLPELLVERVMLLTTAVGDTILDPFLGSGTTLRAAKDLGRKGIGIEIEERYCEIAAKRMSQATLPLYDEPVQKRLHASASLFALSWLFPFGLHALTHLLEHFRPPFVYTLWHKSIIPQLQAVLL